MMPGITPPTFTTLFDEHLLDICENINRLGEQPETLIGISGVDDQHSELIKKYNEFVGCLRDGGRRKEVAGQFKKLLIFLNMHFMFEEKIMVMIGYPRLEIHRRQHRDFIVKVQEMADDVRQNREAIESLTMYIGHWILGHTLIADKDFGDFEAALADDGDLIAMPVGGQA